MLCMFAIKGDERRQKIVLVGLAMTLFPYIPASNLFFPVGFVVAERVLYLPSMGFCMLVGYGAWCLMQSVRNTGLKAIVAFFLLGLLALQAGRTVLRNLDWESNLSLYTSGARFNPANGVMLTNLGVEHGRLKNYSFAERLYRTSIKVAPTHSRGYGNLGGLLEALRRYDEAESVSQWCWEGWWSDILVLHRLLKDDTLFQNCTLVYRSLLQWCCLGNTLCMFLSLISAYSNTTLASFPGSCGQRAWERG